MGFVMDQPAIPVKRVVVVMFFQEVVISEAAGIQIRFEAR